MEATFKISERDYVQAMRLHSRVTTKTATLYALATIVLALAAWFGASIIQAGAIGGLIGGLIAVILGNFLFRPWMARRHYRNYPAIREPITISLENDGIGFRTADADGMVKWDKIIKWRQNENYLLIYIMPRLYYIVPKTGMVQGFDFSLLEKALHSHVGGEK